MGALATAVTAVNGLTAAGKTIVAVLGFLVALISLVALRSFTAVLFIVGFAIFGGVGLAMIRTLMGASLTLI